MPSSTPSMLGLGGDPPLLRSLFLDAELGPTFGTSSPHIRLVWALEALAWSPAHMSRAAGALARLAEIDPAPDANIHPRPAGSLANVFNLYSPQTSLPLARRLDVLDGLRHRSPAAAWRLLRAILPTRLTILSPSYHPRWRSWALVPPETITYAELFAGVSEIVTRIIEDAGKDPGRWLDLVCPHRHPARRRPRSAPRRLRGARPGQPRGPGTTGHVAGARRPRRDSTGSSRMRTGPCPATSWTGSRPWRPTSRPRPRWTCPSTSSITARVSPVSIPWSLPVRRGAADRAPGRGACRPRRRGDRRAPPPRRRGHAPHRRRMGGGRGPRRRPRRRPAPAPRDGRLGRLGRAGLCRRAHRGRRPGLAGPAAPALARRRVRPPAGRAPARGHAAERGPRHDRGRPAPRRAARPSGGASTRSFVHPDARPLVARKLMEHRRPWGAIDLLVTMLHALGGAVAPDVDLVESALMSAATGPSDDSPRASSLSWEVGELLDYLERSGSDIEIRARLEFLYAHLLQHTRPARALNEVLADRPRALRRDPVLHLPAPRASPATRRCPRSAARSRWSGTRSSASGTRPPACVRTGPSTPTPSAIWVTEARRLLADSGRTTIGDLVIGEVLAYVPPDSDGLWPAEPVRDLIEDLRSPKFEAGLHTGKFNSRGMTSRSPADGGAQERALAAQHRDGPTASPTGGRAPEPSCARSRTTTRSGRAGRTISPSASGTTAPELSPTGVRAQLSSQWTTGTAPPTGRRPPRNLGTGLRRLSMPNACPIGSRSSARRRSEEFHYRS